MLKEYQVLPGDSQTCGDFGWKRNLNRQSHLHSSIRRPCSQSTTERMENREIQKYPEKVSGFERKILLVVHRSYALPFGITKKRYRRPSSELCFFISGGTLSHGDSTRTIRAIEGPCLAAVRSMNHFDICVYSVHRVPWKPLSLDPSHRAAPTPSAFWTTTQRSLCD